MSSNKPVILLGYATSVPLWAGPTMESLQSTNDRPESHSTWEEADKCVEVKNPDSEASLPGFKSWLFHNLHNLGPAILPLYAKVFSSVKGAITVSTS